MGTSIRPVLLIFAGQSKDGRPGRFWGADAAEPVRAFQDDLRGHGVALDVVDVGGFVPQPGDRREGGAWARFAAPPLDGGHQRCLFAAYKSPGAFFDVQVKAKSVPRMFSPSRPYSCAWAMAVFRWAIASGYSARQ